MQRADARKAGPSVPRVLTRRAEDVEASKATEMQGSANWQPESARQRGAQLARLPGHARPRHEALAQCEHLIADMKSRLNPVLWQLLVPEVDKQYPQYSGQNYLDMTAGFFYA